jgi:hypothetical protein
MAEVYFRTPESYLDPATLVRVLQKRLTTKAQPGWVAWLLESARTAMTEECCIATQDRGHAVRHW